MSQKGIEVDLEKEKAILEMPEPHTERQVRGFLGRLNYIARFISQFTAICEPLFKLLPKNQSVRWNEDCQEAFGRVKKVSHKPSCAYASGTQKASHLVYENFGRVVGMYARAT